MKAEDLSDEVIRRKADEIRREVATERQRLDKIMRGLDEIEAIVAMLGKGELDEAERLLGIMERQTKTYSVQ